MWKELFILYFFIHLKQYFGKIKWLVIIWTADIYEP